MSSVRNSVLSGAIAAVIAVGLIVAVLFIPGAGLGTSSSSTPATTLTSIRSSQSSTGVQQQQQSSTTSLVQSSSSSNSGSQTASSSSGQGAMAVLLTDPPTVPENVSALYMQYDEVQAHIANAGNQTGWYELLGTGVINLMSAVNVSQTIANQTLPQGKFNGLRFNVTGITVTYEGQNYTGLMVNGENTLYVWIPGGINVTAAQTTAALIDLAPTVIMAGNSTNPTFVFIPSATGYVIPTSSIPAESHVIGGIANLKRNPWWIAIEHRTKFGITSVTLTPNSLNITIVNQGTASVLMRLTAVTTQTTISGGMEPMLAASDLFAIESNGTLVNLNTICMRLVDAQFATGGLLLAPGQSVILHYSGAPIEIGVQLAAMSTAIGHMQTRTQPIIPGKYYEVWVQGNDKVAQAGVKATGSTSTTTTSTISSTITATPITPSERTTASS